MKTPSDTYTGRELSKERVPVELYRVWIDGGSSWYYTSGDVSFVYNGNTYTLAPIERGKVEWDSNLEVSRLDISAVYLADPVIDFLTVNPVGLVWVEVLKLFRDFTTEAVVIFIGQIREVTFKGNQASIGCVGFEAYLGQMIPKFRYQSTCNWTLFDSNCQKATTGLTLTTEVDVDDTGLTLESTDLSVYAKNYFKYGKVVFGDSQVLVTWNSGDYLILRQSIPDLVSGDEVVIYAGCLIIFIYF